MQSKFATTSWSQVLAARDAPSSESRRALDVLCRTYWYPVYAFVRRQVGNAADAGDLTQSYFAELLEKSYLEDYDPARGRFRVFLKTSVKHFLSKQREKSESWKRGAAGGRTCFRSTPAMAKAAICTNLRTSSRPRRSSSEDGR
jgi:RNA polymerase sigma-70 factor (ECF subfamily)